jgi:hypothetical protein
MTITGQDFPCLAACIASFIIFDTGEGDTADVQCETAIALRKG